MSSLDLPNCAYFFAQTLDNSGEAEYWGGSDQGGRYDKLGMADPKLTLIRKHIDEAAMFGKFIFFKSEMLDVRMSFSGLGLISVRPSTLDIDGRISPVLMIFNVRGDLRNHVATVMKEILGQMGRDLSRGSLADVEKLQRILNFPRPVLFFTLFLSKIWNKING
ncbi:hypothetical protein [Janthinobacterium lividum]|uniref:hypothetical protein n=1 Tax=Janthinobacterium lividum TaxID=29581 RepID=UPI0012690EE5|nr:hypothetical protein [Janthinobacterium lividum]